MTIITTNCNDVESFVTPTLWKGMTNIKLIQITDDMIDNIINLRPLNWRNNASKSNSYPFYSASLVADDAAATNVETNIGKVVNEGVQAQLKDYYHLTLFLYQLIFLR